MTIQNCATGTSNDQDNIIPFPVLTPRKTKCPQPTEIPEGWEFLNDPGIQEGYKFMIPRKVERMVELVDQGEILASTVYYALGNLVDKFKGAPNES